MQSIQFSVRQKLVLFLKALRSRDMSISTPVSSSHYFYIILVSTQTLVPPSFSMPALDTRDLTSRRLVLRRNTPQPSQHISSTGKTAVWRCTPTNVRFVVGRTSNEHRRSQTYKIKARNLGKSESESL
jgi:hypothetical protein